MAGFSLRGGGGGGGGGDRGGEHPIGAESLFLYARSAAASGADTAAGGGGGGGGIGFQLWHPHHQQPQQQPHHTSQFFSSNVAAGVVLGFSSHDAGGAGGGAAGIGGGPGAGGRAGTSCQDCGNNAKKDCVHMRCRTCCRSRGFSCPTHVKSTWVPAAKRRERQQQLAALFRGAAAAANSGGGTGGANMGAAPSKRPRELVRSLGRLPTATMVAAATTTSSGEGARFPPELSLEAVFRCVRIGPVDEPDAEFAYQTAVNIGGHTFKGILRDHGPDAPSPSSAEYQIAPGREEASSPAGSSEAAGGHAATSAAVLMDPYPTPIGAFAAGTQFFPHNPRT